jgi:3-dehydrosphinganine reductase
MNQTRFVGPDKVALITGGSSGIGLALAQQLIQMGSHVWIMARNPDRLSATIGSLEKWRVNTQQQIRASQADVSNAPQVFHALEDINDAIGTPHLVINCAGSTYPGYVQDISLDIFHELMEINYFGSVHVTKAVLPGMLIRGSGHLVYISSLGGLIAVFGYTAYCATKYALHGFADALRQEMKPHGIHVSIACPPDTDTPQLAFEQPLKPMETKALVGNSAVVSPDFVAQKILSGIIHDRYLIIPSMDSKVFYLLKRLLGAKGNLVFDYLIAKAQRKDYLSESKMEVKNHGHL